MTSKQSPTPSGIITKDNGERVIPASKRPDGTIRAERKVRPGYIPPEDVPLYRNKYAQETPLDNDQVNIHNNNNKVDDNKGEMLNKEQLIEMNKKKIKALEKKIRQIERIKEKQDNGENLITDEHEKLKKLEPFKEELNKLLNEIKEQEGEGKKSGSGKGGRNGKK
ncbi:18815_t:CDS:2 [Entrophospora sp. SA101]|nr:24200_t:CDS:2 [Entrophospora sp. SA101]CAJ0765851.1 18815_t:CDS:2 [Entrophospora sp. SA101]CAJ0824853.1 7520_t:CDS:2 [Entrophospora sp. SA101]